MLRAIYLACLTSPLIVLVGTTFSVVYLITPIDEESSNAGAFAFSIALALGMLGMILITVLGLVGATIGVVYEDKLPKTFLYKYWWPALLAAPGILFTFFLAGSSQ